MKRFVLPVLLGLSLAACTSTSEEAAAQPAAEPATTAPVVAAPAKSDATPAPATPAEEQDEPEAPTYVVASCEDVAKVPARGQLDFDLRSESLPKYIDVQAMLEEVPASGLARQYMLTLRLSTVKNWDLYATFGASIAQDSFAEMTAYWPSRGPGMNYPGPVTGEYIGDDSGGGQWTCADGVADASRSLDSFGYTHITVTKSTETTIEGTWERGHTSQDGKTVGAPYEKGRFKAPIVEGPPKGNDGGDLPPKILCCPVP